MRKAHGRAWLTAVVLGACLCAFPLYVHPAPEGIRLEHVYKLLPKLGIFGAALSPDGRYAAIQTGWGPILPATAPTPNWIGLWDVDRHQLLAKRLLATWPNCVGCKGAAPDAGLGTEPKFTQFTSDGSKIVAFDTTYGLQILDAHSLALLGKVDLHLPRHMGPNSVDLAVCAMEVSPDGKKAAVALSRTISNGELFIYDLASGALERKWRYQGDDVAGTWKRVAWSPDGRYLAFLLFPVIPGQSFPRNERNLQVFDVRTGKRVQAIHTSDLAGSVAFATDDLVLTVSIERAMGRHRKDAIEEWDIRTGKRVRKFTSSPLGPRYQLAISGDGRLLMAFVYKERWAERFLHATAIRLGVWDLPTGELLYLSDPIFPSEIPGNIVHLDVDRKGDRVMIWRAGPYPYVNAQIYYLSLGGA